MAECSCTEALPSMGKDTRLPYRSFKQDSSAVQAAGLLPLPPPLPPLTHWHVALLHFRILCSKVCEQVLKPIARLHRHAAPLSSLSHRCRPRRPL